jgi:hypothetical protein
METPKFQELRKSESPKMKSPKFRNSEISGTPKIGNSENRGQAMNIYHSTQTDHVRGTVNLRTYLREYMSAEKVNRVMLDLWKYPYGTFYLPTKLDNLDLKVDIYPASGQFRIVQARW